MKIDRKQHLVCGATMLIVADSTSVDQDCLHIKVDPRKFDGFVRCSSKSTEISRESVAKQSQDSHRINRKSIENRTDMQVVVEEKRNRWVWPFAL